MTGRVADGWLPSMGYADPDVLAVMNAVIDDAARAAGRDPASIRRLSNVMGRFGGPVSGPRLAGMPRDWAEQLARLAVEDGMSTLLLGTDDPVDVRRFGEEVAPLVRDLVDTERAERVRRDNGSRLRPHCGDRDRDYDGDHDRCGDSHGIRTRPDRHRDDA